MILIFSMVGCASFFEAFLKSSTTTKIPSTEENASTEEVSDEDLDTGSIIPEPTQEQRPTEPSQPTTEPSEPASQPVDEPADTAEETGPCGENQICELSISNPTLFGCDSTEPQEIVFSNSGEGSLFVYHKSVYSGCCPNFVPTATADLTTSTILVEYDFTDDFCDCICEGISVRYTLSDIPAGTYQLTALTESVSVVVE